METILINGGYAIAVVAYYVIAFSAGWNNVFHINRNT